MAICLEEAGRINVAETLKFVEWWAGESHLTNGRVYLPTEKLPPAYTNLFVKGSMMTAAIEASNDCKALKVTWRGGWAPARGVWVGREGCEPWPDNEVAEWKEAKSGTRAFILRE
jgi:hypothetical protein